MRIIAYRSSNQDGKVLVEESGGDSALTGDPIKLFEFLLEDYSPCIKICWDLDSTVAPLLKLLGENACRKLRESKRLFYPPFSLFYVPEKVFIVNHPTAKLSLYGIEQYYPELVEPDVEMVQQLGVKLMGELKKMGMMPTKFTSPIAIYGECVMSKLDLPRLKDIPAKAAEFAYRCAARLWIESHSIGFYDHCVDYDLSSAFPSVAKELIDFRECKWVESSEYHPEAIYGYVRCEVTIYDWVMVSPILRETEDGLISPVGTWEEYLTKGELDFITKWKIGEVKILEGWWAITSRKALKKPLKIPMEKLLLYKQGSELQKLLAKRMCFSEDTKIMAQTGSTSVTELELGDLVYSINPETLQIELKPIVALHRYPYSGLMVHYENKRHDFLVSPEHRMLLKRDVGKGYEFIQAGCLKRRSVNRWVFPPYSAMKGLVRSETSLWDYQDIDATVHVKPNKKWASTFEKDKDFRYIGNSSGYHVRASHIVDPGKLEADKDCGVFMKNARRSHDLPWHFATDDWLELLGWYISEGCILYDWKANYRAIALTQKHYKKEIESLLVRMALPYSVKYNPQGVATFSIPHHAVFNYCMKNCGDKAEHKHIPAELFELDSSHLLHLFKTLMLGDGSNTDHRVIGKYSTISPFLARDFQQLCIHLGYKTRIVFEDGKSSIYRVFIYSNKRRSCIKRDVIDFKQYDGFIWGVTVADNETVLAGRNNKFEFVGQSTGVYGRMGEDWGEEFGPNFNSVWFSEVSTQVRLQVGEFLYSHGIGPGDNEGYKTLVHIGVDGTMLTEQIDNKDPQWRLAYEGEALVISSGLVYTALTKPKGLKLHEVLALINEHPRQPYYEKKIKRRLTLGDSLAQHRLGDIGKEFDFSVSINLLNQDHDRIFPKTPQTGQQLLNKHYKSKPRRV